MGTRGLQTVIEEGRNVLQEYRGFTAGYREVYMTYRGSTDGLRLVEQDSSGAEDLIFRFFFSKPADVRCWTKTF